MKPGKPERADIDPRYVQFVMQDVIRDVFDALVEFITNSDDSYHRLYLASKIDKDGGPISIEIEHRRKGSSRILVKDRAEGMTLAEMREKIKGIGKKTSGDKDRGFMGRGAKECAVLGKAVFESIKDNRYYKCEFNSNLEFIPYEPPEKPKQEIREKLGILRGNGTMVSLEISRQKRTPRFDTLVRNLPYHFALRDIFGKDSEDKVILTDLSDSRRETLLYQPPAGELKFDEAYEVPGYPGIRAKFQIWRSPETLDGNHGNRFRRDGLIVKGERAIHECSLLIDDFEKDPLASRYFGRIECAHIDKLCKDYDECLRNGLPPPEDNFCLIIDPHRQKGLRREHPFTKALLQIPCERLRNLIEEDRARERRKKVQVANEETKKRLDRLARAAGMFLKQQIEDIEDIAPGEEADKDEFVKKGMLIYPTYFKIAVGEIKKLAVYVKEPIVKDKHQVLVKSEDDAISVLDNPIELRRHKKKMDTLLGYFRLKGNFVKDSVVIEAALHKEKSTHAIAEVVDRTIEEHMFTELLEFEYKTYRVRERKKRSLRLFAKYPEVVSEEIAIHSSSSNTLAVPVRGRCKLVPIVGSNFAWGDMIVQGRQLNAQAEITAKVKDYVATANVRVIRDMSEEKTIPISIELRDEDYGNFRARWADHEGQPNLLLVSARHKSLRRYLGPSPNFEGQNTPHFRVLLAEIVTESVCRKSLVLETQERSWEFHWADEKEDYIIANSVLAELHKRMREFAVIAHSIMLEDIELNGI